jgi:hypothetical protein
MKLQVTLAVACAVATMSLPAAYAQGSKQQQSNMSSVPGHQQVFFRADQLIGRSAQTPVGQNLGDLKEIVFHPEKGIYGVVQTENDRLAALPWSLVTAVTDKAVVFNTSSQELANAPTFTDKQWSNLNDSQFTQQIDSHFEHAMGGSSEQGASSSGAGKGSGASTNENRSASTNLNQGASSSPESSSSSTGAGSSTNSAAGNELDD